MNPLKNFIKEKKNLFSNNWKNISKDFFSKDFTEASRDKPYELTAAEKFGQKNINRLQKLGSGRDRDVYALEPGKVLKIAKNPGGIEQNQWERDLDYLGQITHYETGKDYAVMQQAQKPTSITTKFLRPLKQLGYKDFEKRTPKYYEALEKTGLRGAVDYDELSQGDIAAKRNWGEIGGKSVLIDAGALSTDSIRTHRVKDLTPQKKREWDTIQHERSIYRQKGKVYPYEEDKYMDKPNYPYPEVQLGEFPFIDNISTNLALSESPYITLYHGTTKENAEKIMKEGLKPKMQILNRPEVYTGEEKPKYGRKQTYLTGRQIVAVSQAKISPEREYVKYTYGLGKDNTPNRPKFVTKNPAILKVTIPKEQISPTPIEGKEVLNTYSYQTNKIIPPTQIEILDYEKAKRRGLRREFGQTIPEPMTTLPLIDTYGKSLALKDAKMVTLYHGTTKENAEQIIKEGLKPQQSWGGGTGPTVFLTPSKSAALLHANVGPEKKTRRYAHDIPESEHRPEQAAILKVTVPREQAMKGIKEIMHTSVSRNPEMMKEVFEDPEGGKTLKADVYEVQVKDPIPPTQIELMDINRFKQRAYSESRMPERVGRDYTYPVWRSPEQRKNWDIEANTEKLLGALPPTRDIISTDMAKYYHGTDNMAAFFIEKEGIKSAKDIRKELPIDYDPAMSDKTNPKLTYFFKDPKDAKTWARVVAEHKGLKPAIIEADIPEEKMIPDYGMPFGKAYSYPGSIPASKIKIYKDLTSKDSLFDYSGELSSPRKEVYTSPYQKIEIQKAQGVASKNLPTVDDIGYFYDTLPKEYAEAVPTIELKGKSGTGKRASTWAMAKGKPGEGVITIFPKKRIGEWQAFMIPNEPQDFRKALGVTDPANIRQMLIHETGHIIGDPLEKDYGKKFDIMEAPTMYPINVYKRNIRSVDSWKRGYNPSTDRYERALEEAKQSGANEDVAESFALWHPGLGSYHKQNPKANIVPRHKYFEEQLGEDFKTGMTPREEYEEVYSPDTLIEEGLRDEALRLKYETPKTDIEYQQEYEKLKAESAKEVMPKIPEIPKIGLTLKTGPITYK